MWGIDVIILHSGTRPPTPHNPTLRALAGFFIAAVLPNARPVVEFATRPIKFREETIQPSPPLANPPENSEKTPRPMPSLAPPLLTAFLRQAQNPECHRKGRFHLSIVV
jgi:hypothetical protein